MTVSTTTIAVEYTGNGVTTGFSTSFPFLDAEHLVVTVDGALRYLTTHYTVTGGNGSVGTVTLLTAPASASAVRVSRSVPLTQLTDYQRNDSFPAESHERALDKLTQIDQQIQAELDRALRVSTTEDALPVLPSVTGRAQKFLYFDASGDPTTVTGDPSQPLTHSVYLVYPTTGQTAIPVPADYTPGSYDLSVYVNGVKQAIGVDYVETAANLITLTTPSTTGDVIEFSIGEVFDVTLVRTGREEQSFTGLTSPTITLTTASYTPGAHEVDVFFNGALLATADYTETNSTTITLGFTPVASDEIRVIVGRAINVTNVSRSQVGTALYPQSAAEIAAGVTPVDTSYPEGDVRRYGNNTVPGTTDMTQALRSCYEANAGRVVDHNDDQTYLITGALTLYSNTQYIGRSTIIQGSGAGVSGGLLRGTSLTGVLIDGLEIDGNAANNSGTLTYGITLTGGSNNRITDKTYVHDTTQAGVWVNDEDNTWSYARCEDCGTNIGTDNHGVMFTATAGNLNNCGAGGRIDNAYRKGLTVYSAAPGTITNFVVDGPVISGCGLGGLYLANAAATTDQKAIVIKGLLAYDNYVNLQISNCNGVVGSGVILKASSGGANAVVTDSTDVVIPGLLSVDAFDKGLFIDGCTRATFPYAQVTGANVDTAAFGPAIHVLDSTYCGAPGATVAGSNHTHGIIEEGTTNYSNFDGVLANGATSANYTMVGAASHLKVRQTGVVSVASATALTLPYGFDAFLITGTTNITSIVALGHAGKTVRLIFAGILTFTDGNNLKLAGNFVTTADDTITLVCDGTNWYETGRSVN